MRHRRGALLPGLALVLVGLWLLAGALGWNLPGLGALWPIFPLGFGLGCLWQYFQDGRRSHGLVFTGISAALVGVLFFTITFGLVQWGDLSRLWPVFILIAGAAFLGQWVAQPSERGLLAPGLGALAVGAIALLFTLDLLGAPATALAARLWPVLLIVLGLGLLASYFWRGRQPR
jgi:hypothetical protein